MKNGSVKTGERFWGEARAWVRALAKPVLIVFGVIMLGMVAILRANFSYMDDLGRAMDGYKGWGNFSRYLSNLLAMVLHGNSFLTDISPWGQIVAALLMAVAGVLLLYIIYGRKKFRWWELGVVAMLALNPYFLQCMSYKFDASWMAVAVLGMIVPLAVWRGMNEGSAEGERGLFARRKGIVYVGAVVAGTLTTCMTYQAALGILPMITVVMAARMMMRGENMLRFVGKTVLGYMVGLVVFRVFLMKVVDDYVVTTTPGVGELLPTMMRNLGEYYGLVWADFGGVWRFLIGTVGAWFVGTMMLDAKKRKWLAGLVAVATLMLLGVMSFGIYIIMVRPLFEPRAMLGVGVMICLLAVIVAEERRAEGWRKMVARGGAVAAGMLAYEFLIFGFTYGNALAMQKEYTEFRIEMVAGDLNEMVRAGDVIETAGTIGHAPALRNMIQEYPVLGRLVPVQFREGYWGQYDFLRYHGLKELTWNMFEMPRAEEYPIVREGWYYNLRRRENVVVVELRAV